jgi:hypothetical protein
MTVDGVTCDDQVVSQRDEGADGHLPLEPVRDECDDDDEEDDQRANGLVGDLTAPLAADPVAARLRGRSADRLAHGGHDLVLRVGVADLRLDEHLADAAAGRLLHLDLRVASAE